MACIEVTDMACIEDTDTTAAIAVTNIKKGGFGPLFLNGAENGATRSDPPNSKAALL
jgi:hypothetical protein